MYRESVSRCASCCQTKLAFVVATTEVPLPRQRGLGFRLERSFAVSPRTQLWLLQPMRPGPCFSGATRKRMRQLVYMRAWNAGESNTCMVAFALIYAQSSSEYHPLWLFSFPRIPQPRKKCRSTFIHANSLVPHVSKKDHKGGVGRKI